METKVKNGIELRYETVVRNCVVEFRNVCPMTWEVLAETNEPGVRACSVCKTNVFYCETDEEALRHAKQGHCIAKPQPIASQLPKVYIGQPVIPPPPPTPEQVVARDEYRSEEIKTKALRDLKYSNRFCPTCGFPCPNWVAKCRVCGFPVGSVAEGNSTKQPT